MIRSKRLTVWIGLALCGALAVTGTYLWAQDDDAQAKPQTQPAPEVNIPPLPEVVATVGEVKITGPEIQQIMDRIVGPIPEGLPPEYVAQIIQQKRMELVNEMIMGELLNAYVKAQGVEYTEEDIQTVRQSIAASAKQQGMTVEELKAKVNFTEEDLENSARAKRLIEQTTTDEKIQAFIKEHPSYFDGTTVTASHILIKVGPTAATEAQKKALADLKEIAAKIDKGEMTFADAAKQHSGCPSSEQGGDLGAFEYKKMAPPFSQAAFETEVGKVTGPVRTQFGFHLIKVTDRTKGDKDTPDPQAEQIAKGSLVADLQMKILNQALETMPIEIFIKRPEPMQMMPPQ